MIICMNNIFILRKFGIKLHLNQKLYTADASLETYLKIRQQTGESAIEMVFKS